MKTSDFKTGIKQMSESLKGMTLQLITPTSVRPFQSLREFGNAILSEEARSNAVAIRQAWTTEGIVKVSSFNQLIALMGSSKVTAVQFASYYEPTDFSDYLSSVLGTTE